jgi:hypothetical protein
METAELKDELQVIQEVWKNFNGTWSYEAVIAQLDEEFHFSRQAFDQFTSEVREGDRCLSCGRSEWVRLETGEAEVICCLCGQVAQ